MNRRGLLAGILAAGYAPAAIASGILMPVKKIAVPMDVTFTFMETYPYGRSVREAFQKWVDAVRMDELQLQSDKRHIVFGDMRAYAFDQDTVFSVHMDSENYVGHITQVTGPAARMKPYAEDSHS